MGRPLKDKFFGNVANSGKQLQVEVWFTGEASVVTGWVTRQRGTGKYEVTDGTNTEVFVLADHYPAQEGEACILVEPFGGSTEYARVIHNRTVKTHEGNRYRWSTEAASEPGEADLPLA